MLRKGKCQMFKYDPNALYHARTIAIPGQSSRLKDHGAIAEKEGKKDQIQVRQTFDRRTGEPNGSLSGSARFTLLLTHYGQRSIFARNRPYWSNWVGAEVKM